MEGVVYMSPQLQQTGPIAPIRERLSLSTEKMAKLLQVSSRTVTRWEEEKKLPQRSAQIIRINKLREIVDLASMIYTKDGLREFLFTPQPVFGGKTAFQMMVIDEYDAVLSALASDYEGAGF